MEPLSLPLDYAAIEKILPHRYPFLLVDRIIELEVDKRIVGIKNISSNERYLTRSPDGRLYKGHTGVARLALRTKAPVFAVAMVGTRGNPDCHIILRGGSTPNYDEASVVAACDALDRAGVAASLMVR